MHQLRENGSKELNNSGNLALFGESTQYANPTDFTRPSLCAGKTVGFTVLFTPLHYDYALSKVKNNSDETGHLSSLGQT